jgi:hypothetical protein
VSQVKPEWISELASVDAESRAKAAALIYAVGRQSADQAVHPWWQNSEFAALFGGRPEVTVGLAVTSASFAKIREANGWPSLAEVPAEQDASEFELHFEPDIALDVLTSREPSGSGAIAKFLAKKGEGVQQVEFLCTNVDRATAIVCEQFGVQPVYPETRSGANGTRVNFFLIAVADDKKSLIEFYERPAKDAGRNSR